MIKYILYRLKWFLAKYYVFQYPINVDFELCSVCNLSCSFCPHSSQEKDWIIKTMDFSIFKKVIDDIEGKVDCIKLCLRGESTLHPQFKDFLEYQSGKFTDSRINTNGQYINKGITESMVENIKEICFSVDAFFESTYKAIRGGDFYLLKKNIHNCIYQIKTKKLNTRLVLSFTLTEANRYELDTFKSYWKSKYPKIEFRIRPVWDRTSLERSRGKLTRKNCFMPNRRLVVAANGDVYPCCVQWHAPFIVLGNVNTENLLDIWSASYLQFLRNLLRINDGSFGKYFPKSCQNCDSSESYQIERE